MSEDTPIVVRNETEPVQRFTVDDLPPITAGWDRYRKKVETYALRIDGPFEVETSEGLLGCEDGWLALDARGYPYPIAADEFELIYVPAQQSLDPEPVPPVEPTERPKFDTSKFQRTPGRCVACGGLTTDDEALGCPMCQDQGVDFEEIMAIKSGTHPSLIGSVHGITLDMLPFDGERYLLPDGSRAKPEDAPQALQTWKENNVGMVAEGSII